MRSRPHHPGSANRRTISGTGVQLCKALLGAVFILASCGTDAEGVDDCREIEQARCSAGTACGLVDDVDACKRFYRDQCLHGLSVPSPGDAIVKSCVSAIVAAGDCARASIDEAEASCPAGQTQPQACRGIHKPETLEECSFLAPDGTPPSEGGANGSGGAAAGSGGAPPVEEGTPAPATGGAPAVATGGAPAAATGGTPAEATGGAPNTEATGGAPNQSPSGGGTDSE